jgi:peptidoglycan/xylan/chitin deacetylase (PgdA/CDA1 family)
MRGTFVYLLLTSLIGIGAAGATECAPGALGVSRTIAVDPKEHALLGSFQYSETLPLRDREVVLTFDDGPLPAYTNRILDTLASECVQATFFLVGRMARAYPAVVQRIHDDRHTIANHSQNHPFTFHTMTVEQAAYEI